MNTAGNVDILLWNIPPKKRQKKTRRSFAPGRFPVYNLMKSFGISVSTITAFSNIAAAFFY